MDVGAWDAAAWAALGAWATVMVYIIIGVFAWLAVREARTLREEQVRPWVVVDFDPGFLVHLAIENIGKTVATDVQISFDPPLSSTVARAWDWEDSTVFTNGIPLLPPGKKLRIFFDSYNERAKSDLPKSYEVDVNYQGPIKRRQPYRTRYTLDLAFYAGMALPPKGVPEVVRELESIRKEIARWTSGIHGIEVSVIDKDKDDGKERRRFILRQALTVRKNNGWVAFGKHIAQRARQRPWWLP